MTALSRVLLVSLLLSVCWLPIPAHGASCPYCGQTYGAARPGDEARVNALRASHEASCPSRPRSSSGGGSGSYTPSIPSGPSPAEFERQRKAREATLLNEEGLRQWNQQDFAKAAECFRSALGLDPNRPVIRENLRKAEEILAEQMQQREQARLMDDAKPKVDRMLDELSKEFGGSREAAAPGSIPGAAAVSQPGGGLEFMGEKEPLFSKGNQTSAPVDSRFMEGADSQVGDPSVVKGRMTPKDPGKEREKEAKVQAMLDSAVADVSRKDYNQAIRKFEEALRLKPHDKDIRMDLAALVQTRDKEQGKRVSNPKVEAILDSFEYGRGDWGKSISYLQDASKENPSHLGYRDALAFVQGMSGYFREPDPSGMPAGVSAQQDKQTRDLLAKAEESARKRDYEGAVRYYRQAHERNPSDLPLRDMLHFTEGRFAAQQAPVAANKGKRSFAPSPDDSKALLPAVSGKER
jgi:tetratricopeptide (TPR) repeat protein